MTANTLKMRDERAERRRYQQVQAAKAAIGALLASIYAALYGTPDLLDGIALGALLSPALFAALGLLPLPVAFLETISQTAFAFTIAYLVLVTGGAASPLLIWIVLLPAEAALCGRRQVIRATIAAALAVLAVGAAEQLHLVPASRLLIAGWQLYVGSALMAVIQAALIAAAAQRRQRRADRAVAEGAAMYRFLAENAMDLITLHGGDGRIRFASPAASALLGREPESLIGIAPATLVHADDVKPMQYALVQASYFGLPAQAEVRLIQADGSYVWTEMRCRPAEHGSGEQSEIVAVTRDISERKAHEAELIEARDSAEGASRAKSRFLANMSHELRTPLNAILGFSEVMNHEMFGPLGGPRYREYAGLIHESGGHLLDLINGILDMSKIEAGKFELAEEIFDIAEVTTQAMRFVKLQADRKGVVLKTGIAPDCTNVFADRRAIKQILVNLLTNAVKFTKRGGQVKLSVARHAGAIVIAVRDTGVGISAEDVARLGEPFAQVQSGQSKSQDGTGLGLALVKAFAALHGGEVKLESRLGQGTTVWVLLPHAAVSAVEEAGQSAKEPVLLKGAA